MKRYAILRPLPDPQRWSMDVYATHLSGYFHRALSPQESFTVFPEVESEANWKAEGPFKKFKRWAQQYFRYGPEAARLGADLYHITDHGYGHVIPFLKRTKTVVTFHDALLPALAAGRVPVSWKPRTAIAAQRYCLSFIRRADAVITISEFSKREFLRVCDYPETKIHSIAMGVDPAFSERVPEIKIAELRKRWDLDGRSVVIMAGRSDPHKNMEGALRVFARLVKDLRHEAILLKVGARFTQAQMNLAGELGIRERIRQTGSLPAAEMPAIYQSAHALLFLSWYEGFGLPVLEAMASGVPVLASDRGSLPEVAGLSARITDPAREEDSARALFEILTDLKLRRELIDNGTRRAARFAWEDSLKKTLAVYRSLVDA